MPYPSHCCGRSPGDREYHKCRASRNSCVDNSVPLTVEGARVSHIPVSLPRRMVRRVSTAIGRSEEARDSEYSTSLRFWSSWKTSLRTERWSAVRNSAVPRNAASKWLHTNMLALWLAGPETVGLGRAMPACFTGRASNRRKLSGVACPSPNRAGMKSSLIAFSTAEKESEMSPTTRCTYCHSCCSERWRPVYADWG